MTFTKPVIAGTAALLIIAVAGGVAMAKGGKRDFSRFDTNGDGAITRVEITEAARTRFAAADADGNGSLTLAELEAAAEEGKRGKRSPARMFSHLDTNGDNTLTEAEFVNAPRIDRMFERLDADGDGTITASEMQNRRRGGGRDSDAVSG